MYVKQVCSLCRTTCREYNSLQTYIDEFYKIYDITVKYFDPMLFTQDESTSSDHHPVLCRNCWFHIHEFYEFQQQVLETRMLWEDKSHSKTLILDVKQEVIQENMPTSNTPDNGSLSKSKADADNMFKNNLENEDLETESLTSCENTLKSIQKQEAIQANLHTSNASDNGNLDKREYYKDDIFEYTFDYGDLKTESSISCEDTIASKQTDEKYEENSFSTEEVLNKNEHILPTKRKLRQRTKSINKKDAEPSKKLREHKLTEVTKPSPSTKFNMERARESNALIAEWRPELICDLCSETVTDLAKLRSHFKNNHKTKFYIKCCERKFYHRWTLVEHIQFHLNPEVYKCDICGKSTTTKENLRVHKKSVHEVKEKFKCNICEKLFKRKITLRRHNLTHSISSKDFICSECGKGYLTKQLLETHFKHVHSDDHVCDQCGKTIHGSKAFEIHIMEHAGIERLKFPCDVCGIELLSAYGVRRHKSVYHNDESTIHVCGVCGKVAANEIALLRHKKSVHAATERKHKCTICDKSFTRPAYLREHIAIHTGEDLYQCPHCPQKFKCNSLLHHHRKRKHPVEWAETRKNRPQCQRTNNDQVKKHIAIY